MNPKQQIAFFGTPEFAIPSLDILLRHQYSVCCVITSPDKPAGRKRKLRPPAIKLYAKRKGLRILQPEDLRDEQFRMAYKACAPDLAIVVAFRILPEEIWSMPPLGTFNLHASLLPQYRGAAPINHAIINGEKETGVTTFFLDHKVDTGAILFQQKILISDEDNAGSLHDKLMTSGAALVLKTTQAIFNHSVQPVRQKLLTPSEQLKKAPKINRAFCRINWHAPVKEVHNFIRGLSPFPSAWCILQTDKGKRTEVKIKRTALILEKTDQPPGKVTISPSGMTISAMDGALAILEIQQAGKKSMPATEFIKGIRNVSAWTAL